MHAVKRWDSSRSQLTLVSEVITKAEHELGRLAFFGTVLVHKSLCDLTLVDEAWANFEVGLAGHDLNIPLLGHSLLELLLALLGVVEAEFVVGLAVVPSQSNLLALDEAALCALCVVLKYLHDRLLPVHVIVLCEVLPLSRVRKTHEGAVLG